MFWVAGEAIALGFQHYILSLGTAVMIPTLLIQAIGGTDVRFLFVTIDVNLFSILGPKINFGTYM